ncbi:MAG: type I restriction enzyme HsdR N-terminal domain-containing protein [Bacteroidota bacterium]
MMPELNFPEYIFSTRGENKNKEIFDPARRKYVSLTPEEWVRQHLIQYLIQEKKIPIALLAVEYSLVYHKLNKRCDILVFNRQGSPVMLLECKAPSVALSEKTLEQIARYNMAFKVSYLLVSNGLSHYCFHINHETEMIKILPEIPTLAL